MYNQSILIKIKKIIIFLNVYSADGNYEVRYKSNVLIYPTGEVLWVPPAIYQVSYHLTSFKKNHEYSNILIYGFRALVQLTSHIFLSINKLVL